MYIKWYIHTLNISSLTSFLSLLSLFPHFLSLTFLLFSLSSCFSSLFPSLLSSLLFFHFSTLTSSLSLFSFSISIHQVEILSLLTDSSLDNSKEEWREAKVIKIKKNTVRIHFLGWDNQWDTDIDMLKGTYVRTCVLVFVCVYFICLLFFYLIYNLRNYKCHFFVVFAKFLVFVDNLIWNKIIVLKFLKPKLCCFILNILFDIFILHLLI